MKGFRVFRVVLLVLFPGLLFGCAEADQRVKPVSVEELTIIFQPGSCEFDGPTVIRQGEVRIITDNRSDSILAVGVYRLPEGRTWKEFLDHLTSKEKNNEIVQWAKDNTYPGKPVIDDPRSRVFDFEPGLYALVCAEIFDTGGWKNLPATSLEVR